MESIYGNRWQYCVNRFLEIHDERCQIARCATYTFRIVALSHSRKPDWPSLFDSYATRQR